MSNLFSKGGGVADPQQINVPAFTSEGGITPEQQTLANFTMGQDNMGEQALFGGSGTGMSTMATQGAAGARNTGAQEAGGMSDTDQSAMYQDYTNQVSALETGLQNDITLSNEAQGQSLSDLAAAGTAVGAAFGSGSKGSLS